MFAKRKGDLCVFNDIAHSGKECGLRCLHVMFYKLFKR